MTSHLQPHPTVPAITISPPTAIFENSNIFSETSNTSKSKPKRGMSHLDETSILTIKTRSKRHKTNEK